MNFSERWQETALLVFQRWILRWEKLNVLFVWLDFVVTKLVSIE
ncbi:MAG: hypothetical protein N4435_07915 [Candidatus Ornithobacterium hominis]|nr:hypothetical protein [Candidatus Ornithobacterium hominis]MCT7905108.1 hypothetical protein [Candidatus Ornithobacterium hominis]